VPGDTGMHLLSQLNPSTWAAPLTTFFQGGWCQTSYPHFQPFTFITLPSLLRPQIPLNVKLDAIEYRPLYGGTRQVPSYETPTHNSLLESSHHIQSLAKRPFYLGCAVQLPAPAKLPGEGSPRAGFDGIDYSGVRLSCKNAIAGLQP
jgi:hypothetical protein